MGDKRIYASVAGIASLGVLLGSFLPWVRFTGPFGEFTKRGLEDESDGIITLILGVAVVWLVGYYLFGEGKGLVRSLMLAVLGGAVVAVAGVNLADQDRAAGVLADLEKLVGPSTEETPSSLVAAEGLYMTLIGGIAILLSGLAGALVPEPVSLTFGGRPVEVISIPPAEPPVEAAAAAEPAEEVPPSELEAAEPPAEEPADEPIPAAEAEGEETRPEA